LVSQGKEMRYIGIPLIFLAGLINEIIYQFPRLHLKRM